jgi:hypothetical protein
VDGVWPRVAALLGMVVVDLAGQGRLVLPLVRHRDEWRRASLRHDERLRARVEDAVASLQLRAVDGEVGLVDQLVRICAVAREAGDTDRDRGADRLA